MLGSGDRLAKRGRRCGNRTAHSGSSGTLFPLGAPWAPEPCPAEVSTFMGSSEIDATQPLKSCEVPRRNDGYRAVTAAAPPSRSDDRGSLEVDLRPARRRRAASWNLVTSPKGRATSIAPSRPLTIIRAVALADPVNVRVPSFRPRSRTRASHRFVLVEEADQGVSHGSRQRLEFGGHHAAQAHALIAQDVEVQPGVGVELGRSIDRAGVHLRQRLGEAGGIALDESLAEFRLAGEVVVERGLGDLQLCGDVGVAEAVEATDLHQPFGHVEDLGGRPDFCRSGPSSSIPSSPRNALLTLTY